MVFYLMCLALSEKDVDVKARGRAISRAVDTVELLRQAFEEGLEVKNIAMGTKEIPLGEGKKGILSTIKIAVAQPLQMHNSQLTAKAAAF